MKNHLNFLAILLPLFFAFTNPESPDKSCPEPANVHVTAQSSGSISFDWDDCGCISNNYKVKYLRQSDAYISPVYSTSSSAYTFSSLQAGTYTFYFWTDCGGGGVSEAIVIEDIGVN